MYSATEKVVIRNHVSYVCRKQHCADTLVLYLNSPTRNDGTMLLWDANLNGIVRHTHTHIHTQATYVYKANLQDAVMSLAGCLVRATCSGRCSLLVSVLASSHFLPV